jgi:hypothetical protein
MEMLIRGEAETVHAAESKYLDEHLADVVTLVESPLSDLEFRMHPLIVMLMSHGSRGWEDTML